MKRVLAATGSIVSLAILFAVSFAGSPQSFSTRRIGRGVIEYEANRSTAFASAAIDTFFVDVGNVWQGQVGNAATAGCEVSLFFDNLATGDSLTCAMLPAMKVSDANALLPSAAGIASFQVTGGAAATVTFEKTVASSPARYWRFIVTNNQHASQASIDYKMILDAQVAP